MLVAAYAEWLASHEPSDESRGAVVLGFLRALAAREGRAVPSSLRLVALAGPELAWSLAVPPESLLLAAELPKEAARTGGDSPLDQRLSSAQLLGEVLDLLHGVESSGRRSGEASFRRSSGSYFTPRPVARSLVAESLLTPHLTQARRSDVSVCDPAMGGGAFLLEAVAGLSRLRIQGGEPLDVALVQVARSVFGYDRSGLAVATAEAALWYLSGLTDWGERLVCADSLVTRAQGPERGFDWLIGNPPWVAFQGRAAQKLAPERRAWLKAKFAAFAGYPTLHGVFAERATELAPHGLVSLLLPSSLSDLDGYRAARAAVMRTHEPHEPLLEYGQDAFSGVVQPCFGLIASPRTSSEVTEAGRPWRLRERSRRGTATEVLAIPSALGRLASFPKLPPECFGEVGLQSNRRVTTELFLRAPAPREPFAVPLLEGRSVRAFEVRPPVLFMNPDPRVLRESRCRYRPLADYARVDFVVRQTAAVTIAARHNGMRFRNSLLAGYARGHLDVDLLLGLLNSTLLRAFHASHQRDARQATFPQVKVAHLRRLPAPPASSEAQARVREASVALGQQTPTAEGFAILDRAVFDLYDLSEADRDEVTRYLTERFPARASR